MSLERIVRPFQKKEVFTSRRATPGQPPVPEAEETATLTWSGSADSKYTEAQSPAYLGFDAKWVEDTSRRVTETVRIESEDDPEVFVEVERIKTATFKNTTTGEEAKWKLDWKKRNTPVQPTGSPHDPP